MKNYTINHANGTITLTRDFANKAGILNSPEYKALRQLKRDFPNLEVVQRTAKVSPTKVTHKGLTLDHMEKYITTFEPATDLTIFKKVKSYNTDLKETKDGDIIEIVNYGKMKKWFLNKYPDYQMTETAFDAMVETLEKLEAKSAAIIPEETTDDANATDDAAAA